MLEQWILTKILKFFFLPNFKLFYSNNESSPGQNHPLTLIGCRWSPMTKTNTKRKEQQIEKEETLNKYSPPSHPLKLHFLPEE